ncbi:phage major capsid protein [Metabacillus malikii]|uniref:HK97 family phage major capsid protein n=1 Tax=Metabacillus malikii TaxID=1504265 RepID=A0ABT9ZBQ8_9BACI|nr:phage major capsid protein [Metabacillus malikii]MDQ0229704.1 HK97 family phage major capsid protein [Metabacillus malikii]
MVLKQIQDARLLKLAHQREQYLGEMQGIIASAKKEKRAITEDENKKFESLEKQIQTVDDELEKNDFKNLEDLTERMQERESRFKAMQNPSSSDKMKENRAKKRSDNPLEVRGYVGKERIGNHDTSVTIGDLVYSHVTGKFRNSEVRQALSTTSGGIVVPTDVYENFIDLMRDQNFLLQTTVYPMATKALVIPKLVGDIQPTFKVENELIVESSPVFDSVRLEAKPLYAMTSISLELIESGGLDIGMAVTNIMASSMAQAVQSFMLKGGGANGYGGILNDPNINLIDATTIDYASIGAGFRAIRSAYGNPDGIILNNADAMDLELLTDTTGQFIQPPRFMENLETYSLGGGLDEGEGVVANLQSIAWGILSEGGLQIDIDKSGEAFQRGQIKIRARINSDFALTNPKLISHVRPTV